MRKVTLGGKRLGAGNKNQVELKSYERSTHNLSYVNRFTAAPGTVIPFMSRVAQPGDTWDIGLSCEIMTHPTVGPLFGSFKAQLDILVAAVRLYQGELHMNKTKIGLNMSAVKLPMVEFDVTEIDTTTTLDLDNAQVNPSALIAFLGYRGFGMTTDSDVKRLLCAIPILMYYDCIKQYYCNLQEEIGVVIHTPNAAIVNTVTSIEADGGAGVIEQAPVTTSVSLVAGTKVSINFVGADPIMEQIMVNIQGRGPIPMSDLLVNIILVAPGSFEGTFNRARWGDSIAINWDYINATQLNPSVPGLVTFPLENIDEMRSNILAAALTGGTAFKINTPALTPYSYTYGKENGRTFSLGNQEGLCVKTYLSDLFNAWLNTDWIDGVGGISEITAVSTAGNEFTVDALVMAKKVWEVLNRIAVSDGSYYGWQEAVYDEEPFVKSETAMYMGGMIRELVFQEVISNSAAETEGPDQPLGTLGGRGIMSKGKKGGHVRVKVSEMSHIMGLFSLTPRIDYSQGNNWDIYLETMDDYHKPGLDQIGFQELLQRRMAWWASSYVGGNWVERSAGKQPAWIEYRTAVNEVHGNFAIRTNEMFMVLTRRYEYNLGGLEIDDMTTYIDPQKFNNIFAQTDLGAQNFWVNIGVDCEVRRKMSHAVMPNL